MCGSLSPNHPRQRLLFFVAQNVDEGLQIKVRSLVERLASSREWVIRPPKFVDSTVEAEKPGIDSPVITLGGYIELYSALPGTNLPREVDVQHLEEVEYLVEKLRTFSKDNALSIELELERTFVGSIEDGVLDRTLREGLIGEWRKQLQRGE